ncbi:nucleoside monophosphate kinase [Candidatus Daviesbacteria bacterium]|nr:nucleoside monophosphate kinase [Candidatus Daviesbacteria bacterium]
MKILISGPIGSGKTTQGKLLAAFLNIPLIGTGEALRQMAEAPNSLGEKIKQELKKGDLVDDNLVAEVVKERISCGDCQNGFVMDGYPRAFSQLQLFDPKFNKVFYLQILDEEIIKRLIKRGRSDDQPDIIQKRLALYHQLTEPVLAYFKNQGVLIEIDGLGTIDEIQRMIRQNLDETKK